MATTTTDEQKIESKVIEEVKAVIVEPETVVSAGTTGEEGTKAVELIMEPILPPKSDEEEVGVKQREVTKVVDDVLPVEVKDVVVEKESIPDSIAPGVQEQVAEPADDVPQSSDEVIEKPREQSDVLPKKNEESVEKKDSEDSAPSNEVDDEPVSVAPEIEVKTKEKSEINEQVAKPELDEATEKQDEETEVLPIKSEAVAVENIEDSGAVAKEVEKPEPVLPVIEQSEGTEKTHESSVVHPIEESEAVPVKDTDASEILSKEADETKPVVPEVDVKPEEPSEVTKQIEVQEPVVPEVEAKVEEASDVTTEIEEPEAAAPEAQVKIEEQAKQVETEKGDEKTEPVATEFPVKLEEQAEVTEQIDDEKKDAVSPEVQVKPEAATPIEAETEDPKLISVDPEAAKKIEAEPADAKTESIEPVVELKPDNHTEVFDQSTESKNEKDEKKTTEILSSEGESSLPDVAENVRIEDKRKETDVPDTVEVSSKELVDETGKAGVEKEGSTVTNEGENDARDVPNEEIAQPKIVEDVTNAEVTEAVEAVAENIKEETAALVEPKKHGDIEGKLDEATTTTANDQVKESRDSGPEAKEPESEKPNEDKLVKEKVEDGDDPKITEVVSKEVAAKKQSNNILSKVKQSLVKAKKAIVGKSPGSKTPSSDTIK